MRLLDCKGIRKSFGGLTAVADIDFFVDPGEIVGLIGPNGAGKTTLVNLLTGAIEADAGSMKYDDLDIRRLKPFERSQIGITKTSQIPRPFETMSIRDNVRIGAIYGRLGRPKVGRAVEDNVERALALCGLTAFAASMPATLSTAGLKSLEVARCLAAEPRLLLLDEPLGGLNPVETQSSIRLISDLRKDGITIVLIEHNVSAVSALSDRIFVISRGKKLAEGLPVQVLNDPEVRRAYLGDVTSVANRRARKASQSGVVRDVIL